MMRRIAVIKSVRARDAFEAEREQREDAAAGTAAPSGSSAHAASRRMKEPTSYTRLFVRTVVSLLLILGLVYAVNETVTHLLK
jgi:hypothetical protein